MPTELKRQVDAEFNKKFPELKGRKLTLASADRDYRKEWMDVYVQLGGKVGEIENSGGIRIPLSS